MVYAPKSGSVIYSLDELRSADQIYTNKVLEEYAFEHGVDPPNLESGTVMHEA